MNLWCVCGHTKFLPIPHWQCFCIESCWRTNFEMWHNLCQTSNSSKWWSSKYYFTMKKYCTSTHAAKYDILHYFLSFPYVFFILTSSRLKKMLYGFWFSWNSLLPRHKRKYGEALDNTKTIKVLGYTTICSSTSINRKIMKSATLIDRF